MSEVINYFGIPVMQHPAVPEGEVYFQTESTRTNTRGVFTETALQEALARLKRDNPENPRYMMVSPKQMAMLKNVRWNEPEPLSLDNPNIGSNMFRLVEQEEQKWQDLFSRQYV